MTKSKAQAKKPAAGTPKTLNGKAAKPAKVAHRPKP